MIDLSAQRSLVVLDPVEAHSVKARKLVHDVLLQQPLGIKQIVVVSRPLHQVVSHVRRDLQFLEGRSNGPRVEVPPIRAVGEEQHVGQRRVGAVIILEEAQ